MNICSGTLFVYFSQLCRGSLVGDLVGLDNVAMIMSLSAKVHAEALQHGTYHSHRIYLCG